LDCGVHIRVFPHVLFWVVILHCFSVYFTILITFGFINCCKLLFIIIIIIIIGGAVLSSQVSVQVPRYISKSLVLRSLWPIVQTPMIDEDDFWSNWWNELWQGKPKFSEKTYPRATLSTTKSHMTDPVSNRGPQRWEASDYPLELWRGPIVNWLSCIKLFILCLSYSCITSVFPFSAFVMVSLFIVILFFIIVISFHSSLFQLFIISSF
jgi:hypothetical protein